MKGNVKTLFRKFCLESSVLGVKYFYLYTDRFSRCFWVVTVVSLFYMSWLLTALLYNRFEEMPTRITIENQYEPIINISFPAVTICSPNQITASATRHFQKTLVDGNRSLDVEEAMAQLLGYYENLGEVKNDQLQNLQILIDANRYTALEVMGLLPQKCEDFIKLCFLQGKPYPNCGTLFKPILTQHGMCCIFNSIYYFNNKRNEKVQNKVTHRITTTGFTDALTVVTDYNPDDALDNTLLNGGALRLIFSDWKEFPADEESNLVNSHIESFQFIHLTYTYCSEDVASLPASSRKCYFEEEYTLPYFHHFHNSDCDLACYIKEIQQKCHCTMIYVPYVRQKTACNVTSIPCIREATLQMNKWYESEACDCPRSCTSYSYKVEMITGNLDALPYLTTNPYAGITFNESTSLIHFFFPSPVYVKQKQETVMSLITLSSNLGGIFGLCLGFSVISVLEIIFFIYLAIKNKVLRHIRGRNQSNTIFMK